MKPPSLPFSPLPGPIQWKAPTAQNALDRFIGPGATRAELVLQFAPTVLAAMTLPLIAHLQNWGWRWDQHLVAAFLTFDLVGGVLTNATSAAKRWYHRPGQGAKQHLGFVAFHVFQPTLLVLCFAPGDWLFVAGGFGYLLLAAITVVVTPLYLRRPMAMLFLIGGWLLSLYALPAPAGFAWFLPVYYLKILVSHLLPEAPFQPRESSA